MGPDPAEGRAGEHGGPAEPDTAASPPAPSLVEARAVLYRLGVTPVQAVLGLVLAGALGLIGWVLLQPPPVSLDGRIPMVTVPPAPTTVPPPVEAHAAGAVVDPGLYQLPAGARVADLLAAAGGPTPDADLDRVNLAAHVEDGWQVRVPYEGEASAPSVVTPGGAAATGTGATGGGEPAPVDINAASAAELEDLPGVGPTIAAAIVEHREREGAFAAVEDLLEVPGIGPTRLDDLRELVVVS